MTGRHPRGLRVARRIVRAAAFGIEEDKVMALEKNVGRADRIVRVIVGVAMLVLVSLAFVGPRSPWAYLGILGIVPLMTGLSGACMLYSLFGINTCERI